jgi:hypothetical protein
MATNSFVRVPPDSTGKRLQTLEHTVDGVAVQAQVFHLGSADNTSYIQHVDQRGQASVRFAEGSPTMDAFGNLRTASQYSLGAYEHSVSDNADLWTEEVATGGSITYNTLASEVSLGVTGANGSKAIRTTNRYHFYHPGISNHIIITGACSDIGKAGNTRRWGYFDENNGVFFELSGTQLAVVVRSNTSGSVVESRTLRSAWVDKLDGTGLSGMNIDITKANFFWLDYAWLGVGVVRFGVLAPDGSRWVVHTEENPNKNNGAYMQTGSLPLRIENINTVGTSGSSEFKMICGAVYASSKPDYTFYRHDATMPTAKSVVTNTPLVSIKPAITFAGKTNRVGLYPESISVFVSGGAIALSIHDDATLTGATFAVAHETALHDFAATALTPTDDGAYRTWFLSPGTHNIDITDIYELNDEGYHVLADATDAYIMSLAATKLEASASVFAAINYRELR